MKLIFAVETEAGKPGCGSGPVCTWCRRRRFFPGRNATGSNMEKGVGIGCCNRPQGCIPAGAAAFELAQQVAPFMHELPTGCGGCAPDGSASYFAFVKGVAALPGLISNSTQIGRNRPQRIGLLPEALELRVVPVPFGFAAQHGLGQKRLAPQRDKAPGIEILWMKRP